MNKVRIHFIGTHHGDPQGPARLQKALEYESPDLVTVEIEHSLLDLWKTLAPNCESLLGQIDSLNNEYKMGVDQMIERLAAQLYEVTQSLEFGKKYNRPVRGVGFEAQLCSRSFEERIELLLAPHVAFLKTLKEAQGNPDRFKSLFLQRSERQYELLTLDPNSIEADYDCYHRYFTAKNTLQKMPGMGRFQYFSEHQVSNIVLKDCPEDVLHDFMAANFIEQLVRPGMKIAHVGGLFHCLEDAGSRTLFSQLKGYNPTRATLKWYERK